MTKSAQSRHTFVTVDMTQAAMARGLSPPARQGTALHGQGSAAAAGAEIGPERHCRPYAQPAAATSHANRLR